MFRKVREFLRRFLEDPVGTAIEAGVWLVLLAVGIWVLALLGKMPPVLMSERALKRARDAFLAAPVPARPPLGTGNEPVSVDLNRPPGV